MKKLSIIIYKKYIFNKYIRYTRTLIFLGIVILSYRIGTGTRTLKCTHAS